MLGGQGAGNSRVPVDTFRHRGTQRSVSNRSGYWLSARLSGSCCEAAGKTGSMQLGQKTRAPKPLQRDPPSPAPGVVRIPGSETDQERLERRFPIRKGAGEAF